MADLTANEILKVKQALSTNNTDGSLTERVVNIINNASKTWASVSYSIAAESGNTITVSCQFKDADGDDMAEAVVVRQYLAEDATGQAVEAAATSLAVGTDGTILVEETSNAVWTAVTEADGDLDIVVGDAVGVDTYHIITVGPDGRLHASAAITFA